MSVPRKSFRRATKPRPEKPARTQVLTGTIEIHRGGSGHLLGGDPTQPDVFIPAAHLAHAMHGDKVEVELIHDLRRGRGREQRREGRVVNVLERVSSTVVGTLQQDRKDKAWFLQPDDMRFPHQVVVPENGGARSGDKVVAELAPWKDPHAEPHGRIVEVLGPAHAPGVDMLAIARKYDLRAEFPAAVQREAEEIPEQLTPRDWEGREDLRNQPAVSIDPDDARDFDDAIHVERLGQNGWRLSVHIADVSHYVFPGTALDAEAKHRGNSTYLVDRVFPMLPERLSNGICSLKPHVERLAFSAFIDFDREGEIKKARFARTVIKSAARLSYRQAFAILQGEKTMPPLPPAMKREEARGQATLAQGEPIPVDPAIAERVQIAWELASVLRRRRFAEGSLDLDFPEVKIWLDENGRAARMEKVENDASHQLIEECMLAANEVVAREIRHKAIPAVFRNHEQPDPERLLEFRQFAADHGFKFGDLTQRSEVQKVLRAIQGSHEEYAIKLQFLKSLKRAVYGTKPLGHYGLAKVNYAHFTSPIRRYADLVVHRSLAFIIAKQRHGKPAPAVGNLEEIALYISQTERASADAERDSVAHKKMEYFQRQLASRQPQEFEAVITDARFFGLLVELPEILTSGGLPSSELPGDQYFFDAPKRTFIGRKSGRRYKIGDRLKVVIARVDVLKRQLDFKPVGNEPPIGSKEPEARKPKVEPKEKLAREWVKEKKPRRFHQPRQSPTAGKKQGRSRKRNG